MDCQFNIVMALFFFVNGMEVFFNIFIRDDPLQLLPCNLLSADPEILFSDRIEDLDSLLGVGKDNRLLKIFQDDLVEILLYSIHPDRITPSIHNA